MKFHLTLNLKLKINMSDKGIFSIVFYTFVTSSIVNNNETLLQFLTELL